MVLGRIGGHGDGGVLNISSEGASCPCIKRNKTE